MALGQSGVLRYGHFDDFLEYRLLKIGLCIKVNTEKNKFEVHI